MRNHAQDVRAIATQNSDGSWIFATDGYRVTSYELDADGVPIMSAKAREVFANVLAERFGAKVEVHHRPAHDHAAKKKLVIHPCCTSCGLPGDVGKPYVVTAADVPKLPPPERKDLPPKMAREWEETVARWWDAERKIWTGSPFFNAAPGQTVRCCDYVIDPTVKNAGHDVPAGFETNDYGQIVAPGIPGQFCSVFCLAMEMFLYRNRRCANCANLLPKKNWLSPENAAKKGKAFRYPKYKLCPQCEADGREIPENVMTTGHVMRALGMETWPKPLTPAEREEPEAKMAAEPVAVETKAVKPADAPVAKRHYRCANPACGAGVNSRGQRVRAIVASLGEFCSSACRKVVKLRGKDHEAYSVDLADRLAYLERSGPEVANAK